MPLTLLKVSNPQFKECEIERLYPTKLYYLCTPYTRYAAGLKKAHEHACILAAQLIEERIVIFCPIAHGHDISMYGGLDPRNAKQWWPLNRTMLGHCDAVIVAQLPGWCESAGIFEELSEAHLLDKPIHYLTVVDG